MATTVLGLRMLLAVVFLTAGVGKLVDLSGSRQAVEDFGVPERAARTVGLLLPLAELVAALALVFRASARWGALLALLLLAAFIAGIARALSRGEQPDCHCFGQLHSAPAGRSTLARNGVLAALAVVIVAYGSGPAVDAWVSARSAAELAAVGLGICAAAAVAYALTLLAENRSLKRDLRLARNVGAVGARFGLPVGTEAPVFAVQDTRGEKATLSGLLQRGHPALLLFMSPYCGPCGVLVPKVRQWQQSLGERLTISIISTGTPEQNAMFAEQGQLENVLLQEEMEVADAYQVQGTPSAVVVSRDGKIASTLGQMENGIEPLVRLALRQGTDVVSVEGSVA
jgi:methylamine dehydrogenase accessory protein MauD